MRVITFRSRLVLAGIGMVAIAAGLMSVTWLSRAPTEERTRMYATLPDPREMAGKQRLFVSGHSLTSRAMLNDLQKIAAASGLATSWEGQLAAGSSIRDRSLGQDPSRPWSGFEHGQRADGSPADVQAILKSAAENGDRFEALLITEQHRVLDSLVWQGTKQYLRAYRDAFTTLNPQADVLFFTPWIDLSDKDDPTEWIAYERAAWPVWKCIVARVNQGIEGGGNRAIRMIPASLALAELVEHLKDNPDQPGFEGRRGSDLTDTLFSDRVHLTPLGSRFVAAVTAAVLYGGLPSEPRPGNVPADQAMTVQKFAADFVDEIRRKEPTFGAECGRTVGWAFVSHYTGYIEKTYNRPDMGFVRAKLRRMIDFLRFAQAS